MTDEEMAEQKPLTEKEMDLAFFLPGDHIPIEWINRVRADWWRGIDVRNLARIVLRAIDHLTNMDGWPVGWENAPRALKDALDKFGPQEIRQMTCTNCLLTFDRIVENGRVGGCWIVERATGKKEWFCDMACQTKTIVRRKENDDV